MAEIVLDVDIDAPPERVWAALVAWDTQGEWMLLTRVRGTAQNGIGVGGGIEGFTGIGPVGVLDIMEITRWDPPRRVEVHHTGRVVKGTGGLETVYRSDIRLVSDLRRDFPLAAADSHAVDESIRDLERLIAQVNRPWGFVPDVLRPAAKGVIYGLLGRQRARRLARRLRFPVSREAPR